MDLRAGLLEDTVSHVGYRAPVTVDLDARLRDAIARMQRERVGCVLVCERGRLRGIFTERDVLVRVVGAGVPVDRPLRDCITLNPVTVRAAEPVAAAIRKMHEGGHRHLPVIDDRGNPLGTVSVKRLVYHIAEHFQQAVYNLPPLPDHYGATPEGA